MHAALRVFVFFSIGYFVSYLFRGLNIGFAAYLIDEMGLSAADLGMLTSLYFLGFAAAQIPAGAALDTWGPRRVTAALLLLAAAGSLIFGASSGFAGLMAGRLLIGAGVAVSLAAALQALAQQFANHRLPAVNGTLIAIGGLGGVLVGTPLTALLEHMSWRSASYGMAAFTALVAAGLWFGAVDAPVHEARRSSMLDQFKGTWEIMHSKLFWQMTFYPAVGAGVFYGVQSLWVKPYLLDVNGLGLMTADALISLLGVAAVVGSIGLGVLARRLERVGISLYAVCGLSLLIFLAIQLLVLLDAPVPKTVLWFGYGCFGSCSVLMYAVLVETFPRSMWGRVNTTFTMLGFFFIFAFQNIIGWIVELWAPIGPGVYPAQAHQAAWWVFWVVQALSAVWYFWPSSKRLSVLPA